MSKMIMPITYKLLENGVQRSDGASIPDCDGNRDWRAYQEWLAEGNTPEPMDLRRTNFFCTLVWSSNGILKR